jgi:hypothetical protein
VPYAVKGLFKSRKDARGFLNIEVPSCLLNKSAKVVVSSSDFSNLEFWKRFVFFYKLLQSVQ